jgi:hypothetical protein
MQNLEIPATARTPAVLFDFGQHQLKIKGESYPEDVTEFYGPVFSALDTYLANLGEGQCRFDFELIYLNSSSAKAIMMLMDKLDLAASKGATVDVYWQGRRHYAGAWRRVRRRSRERQVPFGEDGRLNAIRRSIRCRRRCDLGGRGTDRQRSLCRPRGP